MNAIESALAIAGEDITSKKNKEREMIFILKKLFPFFRERVDGFLSEAVSQQLVGVDDGGF
jgi:hypothetical protein